MAFCSNCGLKLMDGAKFCPICGTRTPLAGAAPTPPKPAVTPLNDAQAEAVTPPEKKRVKKSSVTMSGSAATPVIPSAAPVQAAPDTAPVAPAAMPDAPVLEPVQAAPVIQPVVPAEMPRQAAVIPPAQAEQPIAPAPKSKRKTAAPVMQQPVEADAPQAVFEAAPVAVPVAVPEAAPEAVPVKQAKPAKRGASLLKKKSFTDDDYDDAYDDDEDETDLFEDIDPEPDGNVHDLSVGARSALAYGSILFLVPLLTAKDSRYARFHAVQGFNLFLLEVVGSLLVWLISVLLAALLGGGIIGVLLGSVLPMLFGLLCSVLAIMGVVHACRGQMKRLLLIGRLRIMK
ncbi:MAG: zinc-ribbon domain-containing protein [Eubacteriales bacterium]|nr:zinc-ribbon domain-containing protein [Eubacteriales bacterium]